MQIRCSTCTKTIAIAPTGALPPSCPHCRREAVPGQLGPYVLDRLLATGGMGEVFLAHHNELGTNVAVKLLAAMPLDAADGVRRRFAREAKVTAKVDHPGIVRVLASDVAHDRPYLVLELVDGETLRHRIDHGPQPFVEAVRIVRAIADVLAATHAVGVLHRDIKPDNVMVQADGAVRVLDFGIARALADDAPLTRTGEILGTPEYMAPEQLLDGPEATDARTDVHALGVLLYELLTARSPFRAANLFQALKLIESLTPPPPSRYVAEIPAALDEVVHRAMQKRAEDRHASAQEFADALLAAVPDAQQATPTPAAPSPRAHLPWLAVALIGLMATLLVTWSQRDETDRGEQAANQPRHPQTPTPAQRLAELQQRLREGHWCTTLSNSDAAYTDGVDAARAIARRAFVRSRAAWFRAANLPAWLAANDLRRQRHLLGDPLEPTDNAVATSHGAMAGETTAWRTLCDQVDDDDALPTLLQIGELPVEQQADAFAGFAQRLPIEEPEHWLARTIERHLRGDTAGGMQAAEMAWLSGGGEVAVLLDAALTLRTTTLDAKAATTLWKRIGKADRQDCPASTLLLLRLEARGQIDVRFEPVHAATMPPMFRDDAIRDLLDDASHQTGPRRLSLLRLAVALDARPEFALAPWTNVSTYERALLEREAKR